MATFEQVHTPGTPLYHRYGGCTARATLRLQGKRTVWSINCPYDKGFKMQAFDTHNTAVVTHKVAHGYTGTAGNAKGWRVLLLESELPKSPRLAKPAITLEGMTYEKAIAKLKRPAPAKTPRSTNGTGTPAKGTRKATTSRKRSRRDAGARVAARAQRLNPFKAKSDSDYAQDVPGGTRRRSRPHEGLVNGFSEWLQALGYDVVYNKWVDLAVREPPVFFEAKSVRKSPKLPSAIREAVGQLYEYRYFLAEAPQTGLVLVLDTEVPGKWVSYLDEDREIGLAWRAEKGFALSPLAASLLRISSE